MADCAHAFLKDYYRNTKNKVLRYPNWPGIVTKRGEVIPFELCSIHPHQQYKKQLSPEMMTQVLNFSKKTPEMRFEAIKYGVKVRLQLTSPPFRLIFFH